MIPNPKFYEANISDSVVFYDTPDKAESNYCGFNVNRLFDKRADSNDASRITAINQCDFDNLPKLGTQCTSAYCQYC